MREECWGGFLGPDRRYSGSVGDSQTKGGRDDLVIGGVKGGACRAVCAVGGHG